MFIVFLVKGPELQPSFWNMGQSSVKSGPDKRGTVRGLVQLQIGPLKWTGPVHF